MDKTKLITDFMALHAELATIDFIKKAEGSTGGRSYKYLDLPSLLEMVKPILHKHNFVWYTRPGYTPTGEPSLLYSLAHSSGAEITGEILLQLKSNDPQAQGSAITYARRYALTAVLDIAADEDDDGKKATDTVKEVADDGGKPIAAFQRNKITQMLTRIKVTEAAYSKAALSGRELGSLTNAQAAQVIDDLNQRILQMVNAEVGK